MTNSVSWTCAEARAEVRTFDDSSLNQIVRPSQKPKTAIYSRATTRRMLAEPFTSASTYFECSRGARRGMRKGTLMVGGTALRHQPGTREFVKSLDRKQRLDMNKGLKIEAVRVTTDKTGAPEAAAKASV